MACSPVIGLTSLPGMSDFDLVSTYDYRLPPELIADVPLERRDASRMMTVDRTTGDIAHRSVTDLPALLRPDDVLVLNETRVIPAALRGVRTATGGKWEGLFLGATGTGDWRIIGQTRGRLQAGETLTISGPDAADDSLELRLVEKLDDGEWLVAPDSADDPLVLLDRFGGVPLPPYIERRRPKPEDRDRYQTVFARSPGAIAAPTAGLHFSEDLLNSCRKQGAAIARLTLHVGLGTFRPVKTVRTSEHAMHSEWCELPKAAAEAIQACKATGGRVIAVGTTCVRTLETVAASGPVREWSGETDIFIRPPYEFRVVDGLLTNFHLPRSTLLMLVCAFAGRDLVMQAYKSAIGERYRFYSYGDCMLML